MISEYYKVLGVKYGCSSEDVKGAYRQKARIYHPDINKAPDAAEMFIKVNEAYIFLTKHISNLKKSEQQANDYIHEWEVKRKYQARDKARYYSKRRYSEFRNSDIYRNARLFDGTLIMYGLITSLLIIVFSIFSYTIQKRRAILPEDEPSLFFMILILIIGLSFLILTATHLVSYMKKPDNKTKS